MVYNVGGLFYVSFLVLLYTDTLFTRINPSDFSFKTEIDPPHPFLYECICLHTSLDSLELLSDPQIIPGSQEFISRASEQNPPFLLVSHMESDVHMDCLTLFEYNEMPYVAFVERPDRIVIIDLTCRVISTMICSKFEQFSDVVSYISVDRRHQHSYIHFSRHTVSIPSASFQVKQISLSSALLGTIFHFRKQTICTLSKFMIFRQERKVRQEG